MNEPYVQPAGREQPWSDAAAEHGQIVIVTDNPIGRALRDLAAVVGRRTTMLLDVDASPLQWLTANPLSARDALVLCDHDTPDADGLLRLALAGDSEYIAMMGSRRRAESVFASLADVPGLDRLRVPAGLNIGGKGPGEIALSVLAQIIATSYGRDGTSMKTASAG